MLTSQAICPLSSAVVTNYHIYEKHSSCRTSVGLPGLEVDVVDARHGEGRRVPHTAQHVRGHTGHALFEYKGRTHLESHLVRLSGRLRGLMGGYLATMTTVTQKRKHTVQYTPLRKLNVPDSTSRPARMPAKCPTKLSHGHWHAV